MNNSKTVVGETRKINEKAEPNGKRSYEVFFYFHSLIVLARSDFAVYGVSRPLEQSTKDPLVTNVNVIVVSRFDRFSLSVKSNHAVAKVYLLPLILLVSLRVVAPNYSYNLVPSFGFINTRPHLRCVLTTWHEIKVKSNQPLSSSHKFFQFALLSIQSKISVR